MSNNKWAVIEQLFSMGDVSTTFFDDKSKAKGHYNQLKKEGYAVWFCKVEDEHIPKRKG